MATRLIHQFQIFPILLIILSIVEFRPLLNIVSHEHTTLIMSFLCGGGLLLSFSKISEGVIKFMLGLLILSALLTLNTLAFYPSIGVLVVMLTGLIIAYAREDKESKLASDPKSDKSYVAVSFLIYLIPLFAMSPNQFYSEGQYYYSTILAGASVLWLGLGCTQLLKKYKPSAGLLVVLTTLLVAFEKTSLLEILSVGVFFLLVAINGFLFVRRETLSNIEAIYLKVFAKPELIVVGYFVFAAFIGTFFLQMPISQADPIIAKHSLLDSLFTSMSAICVTGLIVLDTPADFSFFGQMIILSLIQLGGLGITSLSAWILLIISSGRLSLSHEETLHGMSGHLAKLDIKAFVKRIFTYFFTMELIGTIALYPAFLSSGDSWHTALWRALFTSVSAFCNAGFAIQSDSLISYQEQPFILLVVSTLIIAGGFAPLLVLDLPRKIRLKRLGLQEKVVFSATVILLFIGFFYFLLVEWDHSLSNFGFVDRISNSWFQSVTSRTAGFNSVNLTETRSVTQLFFMVLMFIGGNPGSTAGGVKTVTIAVLVIAGFSALRKNDGATVFDKRIPHKTVYQALLVLTLGVLVHFVSFFFLSVTQNMDTISLLFETFSALGTVGLSTGATSQLDEIGKIIIIFCMLAGRVGPLTFILLLMKQNSRRIWKIPQEDVSIT